MTLIARWTFAGLGGLWDETENWQKVELRDNARLTHRGLELPQKGGWARVRPAAGVKLNLTEKTLISWLILDDLKNKRPAGSALTLDAITEDKFDGLVFGEQADATWNAGSTFLQRTESPNQDNPVESVTGKLVKLAISYGKAASGQAEIKIYRNDKLTRSYQKGELATWSETGMEAVFGARHTPNEKPFGHLVATIVAAEIHDKALSAAELEARPYTHSEWVYAGPTSSFKAINIPEPRYISPTDNNEIHINVIKDGSESADLSRATFMQVPGLADPSMVSLESQVRRGWFVTVADTKWVSLQRSDGTDAFRKTATFKKVPGLAGKGVSFESLSKPDAYLRHIGQDRLWPDKNDSSPNFKAEATFTEEKGFVSSTVPPTTFIRHGVSLRAVNIANLYLSGVDREMMAVNEASELNLKERVTVAIVPGLADPNLVSIQMHRPNGGYLFATKTGIWVMRADNENINRREATFKKVPGLAGQGWSFQSLAQPGRYIRHLMGKIQLDADDKSSTFKLDASFIEEPGWISEFTTDLPLNDNSWYIISNQEVSPEKVLGFVDGKVTLVALPASGAIDHVLWRLERQHEIYSGFHRWWLRNKADGEKFFAADQTTNAAFIIARNDEEPENTYWTVRPVPWLGSDYFAMTNDLIERQGQALGCEAGAPRVKPVNFANYDQLWRFTFMRYLDDIERPTPPERIKSVRGLNLDYGKKDVAYNQIKWQEVPHADYVKTYPKYLGALGMDYLATESVSDWAVAMARTVLTNVLLTVKDRSKIDIFKGARILIVGDGDGDEATRYPDIGNPDFVLYRGEADTLVVRISEEMMCRTGITHRPADQQYRKYDQTVHEFGHMIQRRLGLTGKIKEIRGTSYFDCDFATWVQEWFDSETQYGVNRKKILTTYPDATKGLMGGVFLANREWFPYEVKYKQGSAAAAVISKEDESVVSSGYDAGAIDAAISDAEANDKT